MHAVTVVSMVFLAALAVLLALLIGLLAAAPLRNLCWLVQILRTLRQPEYCDGWKGTGSIPRVGGGQEDRGAESWDCPPARAHTQK